MKLDTPFRAAARMARTSFRACASFALIHLLANPAAAQSIAGASVSAGTATVSGVGSTNVVVTQTSDKAIVDWRAFSVDAGTSVTFRQPGAASIALNRITGSGTTRIDGSLVANGQVWLLNPNGVLIGAGGSVAVGGFLASTHAISNADFMAGHYQLTSDGSWTAGVVNLGSIVAAEGGYAVLAGNQVGNAGLVQARLGTVALGAGKTFVLDVVGDKLLSFAITEPLSVVASNGALVDNRGVLAAQGGQVLLTARAAAGVVGSVINTSGLVDATAVSSQGGTIVLDGGTVGEVDATGLLSVSGLGAGQTGGTIQAFGQIVVAGDYAALDARGSTGGGSIYLGGGWQGASIGGHASAVRAGVASTAVLDASAVDTGNGGTVELWSDVTNPYSQTLAYGGFYARGGAAGGDGGRIETSGHYMDSTGVTGSAAAALGKAGTWLFDPYDVEIVAPGTAVTTDLFNNGFSGWQVTTTDPSKDTATIVNSVTSAAGTTYTSPTSAGGQFALLTATPDGSYNLTQILQAFPASSAPVTITIYTNYLISGYTGGTLNAVGEAQDTVTYANVANAYNGTSSNGWESQTITIPAGDTYQLFSYPYSPGGGYATSMKLAFDATVSGGIGSTGGVFANSGGNQVWTPTASSKIDVSQITGFLNAGTNVQITTTGAGTDVGNITVSAAIAKSAGAAATLQLDATNAIIVNQAIGSSANALNVTLNAGAGGIQLNNTVNTNGGTLTLNTSGASTQTAAGAFTTSALALAGIGGSHTLTNAANSFTALSGTTGSANLADSVAVGIDGLSTTGALTLASTGAIGLAGTDIFGGATTVTSPGSITLVSGAQISTSGLLALAAGTNFVNQAGANAIATTGAGRWLIYSQAPASDTFGGLVSNNTAVWGATVASTAPGSAPSGNRYLFALSPTITVTPANTHKTYGDTLNPASVGYTTAGLINAATYGNVFTQDQLTGAPGLNTGYGGFSAASYTGTYTLQSTLGSLATTPGYTFSLGSATLTIDPRALILTALTDSRVYDRTTASSLTPTASGLVNGDTISNLSQAFDSANAGNRLLSATNSYVISTTGGQTGSFNYTVTKQTAAGTITPKALNAALTGSSTKTYDGTTTAPLPTSDYQLSGVIQGDTVALNNPANGNYTDKNIGTGRTVTVTGLALTGSSAGNYTVNTSASAAIGSITAKALAASLVGSVAKIYDGGTAATLAGTNYVLAGTVSGDAVALNSPTAGTYDTKNAGSSKTVSVTGLALTGADAGNYTVNAGTSAAIGSITAKTLAASLVGSVAKTYDGGTAATLADGNYVLSGTVAGDAVALNDPTTGTYDTRNAGSGKTVLVSGLTLAGGDAGNYTVNAAASAAIGSIAAKALAASLTGNASKTYDGTTAATLADGNYVLSGTVSGDAVVLNAPSVATYDTKNAGTGKTVSVTGFALTGADAGNYTVNAGTSAAIGSVTAKALAASLTGNVSKTYDGTTAATLADGNYSLTGVVAGEAVALNDPTTGTYDTRNAGSGKTVAVTGLALTGGDAVNYTVNADASAAIGTVAARALAATLTGTIAKTYDGTTAATLSNGNYVLSGAVVGDAVALNDPIAGRYDTKNAGSGKTVAVSGLGLTGADAANYTVNVGTSAAIGSVAAKALTASVTGSVAKTYDGTTTAALADGNYVLGGAVSGDTVALNDPTAGAYDTKTVGTGKTVAVSGLALTGADAGNYTVNADASAAIGEVAARALAASLTGSVAKTYDGTTAAMLANGNYVLTGAVAGDTVAVNDPTAGTYDTKTVGTGKTVSVAGLVLTGADATNYTVNASTSAAIGSVTAKALAASLTGSVSKTYDGTTAAALANSNYVLSGAVSGDSVALNSRVSGSYDTKNTGSGKTVAVSGLALIGADAGNYTVNTGTSAAIGNVTAKALTAGLTGSVSKTYDGTTAANLANGNYALAGTVSGDSVALNTPVAGTYDTKNVGTGKTVAVAGLALTGADSANYTVNASASAAVGTVVAKALTVALVGTVAKTANGGTDATLTPDNFLLAGFVTGEGATVGKTSADYANANAGTGIVVTTTLAASDFAPTAATALSNYVLPLGKVSGPVGTINPSIVIVTPQPATPAAAVVAAIAATAVLPATSVPVPVTAAADAPSNAAVSVAAAVGTVAISVDRSPPSPVAAQQPPTPVDSADAGDPILASVSEAPSEKPASHATRQTSVTIPIAGGLLGQQQALPSRGNSVPGVDQAFSGGGGSF